RASQRRVGELPAQGRLRAVESRAGLGGRRLLLPAQGPRDTRRADSARTVAARKMSAEVRTAGPDRPGPALPGRCPRRSLVVRLALVLVQLSLIGCGGSAVNGLSNGSSSPLTVTSPDLPGGTFPREFTCDGANRLPRLQWSAPPSGTGELVIEMLDPDA